MGRYAYKSNANDGAVISYDVDYQKARAGTGTKQANDLGARLTGAGQWYDAGTWWLRQAFLEYSHTPIPTTELCTTASIVFEGFEHYPSGDPWSLEVRGYDWGGSVSESTWVPAANITSVAPEVLAAYPDIRTQRPYPAHWHGGGPELRARLADPAALRLMVTSNKQWLGWSAGGNHDEYVHFGTNEGGPNYYRPRLEYSTTTLSSLTRVEGASAQLSDGTAVWLDVSTPGVVQLKHNPTGTTYTTVATVPTGTTSDDQFRLNDGAQALALVVDPSDNIYVVGPCGLTANALITKAWVKGAGYTWTTTGRVADPLPAYDGAINQVVATYHAVGSGFIVAAVGHAQSWQLSNQTVVAVVPAANARAGNPTLHGVSASYDVKSAAFGQPVNATGKGMDILALDGGTGVLAVATADNTNPGEADTEMRLWRYTVTSAGAMTVSFSRTADAAYQTNDAVPADGNATVRAMRVSGSKFVVMFPEWILTYSLPSSGLTLTGGTRPHLAGVPSLGPDLMQPKDAIYDAAAGKVWIYYLDQANPRRVMRTGFSPSTYLMDLTETQVATNTGPSGSANVAIRLPRGDADERKLLVHLGNRAAVGTLSAVTVVDTSLNMPPAAPTLVDPGSFSAAQTKRFTWTFADSNPRDAQSAYEAEIRNAATLVSAYAPGKVTGAAGQDQGFYLAPSTLSNNATYEWRVRTHDGNDVVSPWSSWQGFATTTAGTVTITTPAVDNATGLASPRLGIEWTFTGTLPQREYRIRVIRTDTGAQVFDSGYIYGPDVRAYQVSALLSDVEQRVEVLGEDTGGNVSNTAARLVTPSFSAPWPPTIVAQPNDDGSGIEVSVSNPVPTSDSDLPAAGRNDIYRSDTGTGLWVKIGETAPNGTFTDYAASAGGVYDYRVGAVADGEALSEPAVAVSTTFDGLYLHNPVDPAATLRHYLYGGAAKTEDVANGGTELRFVGRVHPVFEFGEQQAEQVKVTVSVPTGPTERGDVEYLRDVVRSHAVWCYRDSRGRRVFGAVRGISVTDEKWGTTVEMTVVRVDYVEAHP